MRTESAQDYWNVARITACRSMISTQYLIKDSYSRYSKTGGLWDPSDDCCRPRCTLERPCGQGEVDLVVHAVAGVNVVLVLSAHEYVVHIYCGEW